MRARAKGPDEEVAMQISELFAVRGYGVVVTGGASGLGLAYA
jgi:hypothetical protein